MIITQVDDNEWFMVERTHKWYKKKRSGSHFTEAYIIGDNKKYLIPNDEEVILEGQLSKQNKSKGE